MTETIKKRVGRIICGSFNALINSLENTAPEIVMEQTIREVDLAIEEIRAELGKVIASKHLANKQLAEKNDKHEDIAEKINYAISISRDDLAKSAISHQLDIEAQLPVLEQAIANAGEKEKEMEGYITALIAKKREMKDELSQYRETLHQKNYTENEITGGQIDNATNTFNRILEKETGLRKIDSLSSKTAKNLDELEKLSRDNRVEERLRAFKAG